MRIIGIDPGIGRMGWGVIDVEGQKIKVIEYGCIETSAKLTQEQRLLEIYNGLSKIFKAHSPGALAVEELFFSRNVTTAFTVGHARGIVLLIGAQNNTPTFSYNPMQVKVAVTGFGGADKKQVTQMIKVILGLKVAPKLDDTADALAIAVTHAFSSKIKNLL